MKTEDDNTGLKMVLSVIVFIFLIGLVVFIFALFGGKLQDATNITNAGAINESIVFNEMGYATSVAGLESVQLLNTHLFECSPSCVELPSSNYTIIGGVVYKN
jgi:hypothetical protein